MNKKERSNVEESARDAINRYFKFNSISSKQLVFDNGPIHEFDFFESNKIIGGVSTSGKTCRLTGANQCRKNKKSGKMSWQIYQTWEKS